MSLNNIDWDRTLVAQNYRRFMCRLGVWFLERAGIKIVEWEEELNPPQKERASEK